MKILNLRKKIIINFSASGILFLVACGTIAYHLHKKHIVENKISQIQNETSQIKSQSSEVESKMAETRKYKTLWSKLTDAKKNTNGIKMDEVNAKLEAIAEKYSISNHSIRIALPETVTEGSLKRTTVDVMSTSANLTFNAVNDVKALSFIVEFIGSLPGYPIITNFEIKKNKSYNTQDLIDISSGKGNGSISGTLDFSWYVYKKVDAAKAKKLAELRAKLASDTTSKTDSEPHKEAVKEEVKSESN